MRLTDYTDYSLRVLLYLALKRDALVTIQEISDAYGISKNHLMKIVQQLGEIGWVETIRGRHGGLRIAARSLELSVGEVVRATENDFALVGCFADDNDGTRRACVIEPQCRLKHVLDGARAAFLAELDRHTIAEIAQPAAPLAGLLGIIPLVVEAASAPPPPTPADRRP